MTPQENPVDWAEYEACDTCGQTAGGQCFDLRYGRDNRNFHTDKPHIGRHKVTRPGRPSIGGSIPGFELGEERKARVEAWALRSNVNNRAEAIRRLLDRALDAPPPAEPAPTGQTQTWSQFFQMLTTPSTPSEEAPVTTMPPTNLRGDYRGSCVACMQGTDTGLAFVGDARFAAAGLTALGIPDDQVQFTLAAATGNVDGRLPEGEMPVVVRVCGSCAGRAHLEVGLWPEVPMYTPREGQSNEAVHDG